MGKDRQSNHRGSKHRWALAQCRLKCSKDSRCPTTSLKCSNNNEGCHTCRLQQCSHHKANNLNTCQDYRAHLLLNLRRHLHHPNNHLLSNRQMSQLAAQQKKHLSTSMLNNSTAS